MSSTVQPHLDVLRATTVFRWLQSRKLHGTTAAGAGIGTRRTARTLPVVAGISAPCGHCG